MNCPCTQSPHFLDKKWRMQEISISGSISLVGNDFFAAIVDVLDECETMWESSDPEFREAIQIRLENDVEGI